MAPLSDWTVYLWTAAGILVSLIMPVARKLAQVPIGARSFANIGSDSTIQTLGSP